LVKKVRGKNNEPLSQKPADKYAPGKDATGNPIAKVFGKAAELAVGAKVRKVTINSQFLVCPLRGASCVVALPNTVLFTEKL